MESKILNPIKLNYTNSKFAPDDASKGLFMFLIFQTLVTLVYNILALVGLSQPIWSYVFTVILDFCFIGCVYSVSIPKNIDAFSNLKLKKAPNIMQILACVGISVFCLFGFSPLTNLFLEFLYGLGYTSTSSSIVIPDFFTYLMYVVLICVIPAVCEEILFRGLICNGLKKIGTKTAIFGSAFLFMIMHGGPDQTVHQFILGVVLALVFLTTNNLWASIIVHFLNNFIAVTMSYIYYGDSSAVSETTGVYLIEYVIYALISTIVVSVLIYLLLKFLSKHSSKNEEVEPVGSKTTFAFIEDGEISYMNMSGSVDSENFDGNQEVGGNNDSLGYNIDPVFVTDENHFSGSGKVMLVISIVWLAIDWVSALLLGFMGI